MKDLLECLQNLTIASQIVLLATFKTPTPYIISRKVYEHPHWCSIYDHAIIFLTSKFGYLPFCNPTHKTETGFRWETTSKKPPGPIRNREQQSDYIFHTLLQQVYSFAAPLPASGHCENWQEQNHFPNPNRQETATRRLPFT